MRPLWLTLSNDLVGTHDLERSICSKVAFRILARTWALGVVGIGPAYGGDLRILFEANDDSHLTANIRSAFAQLGYSIENTRAIMSLRNSTFWRITSALRLARRWIRRLS
jgi:hypothetical protein